MYELLLEHARGTAVLPTTLPLEAACTAAAKAAEALVTGTPAAPGTTTMVPPSAYEVAYALRIRGKQYQRAAGCQFELAERLEAEWRGRIEGRIRPAGESEADGRRRVHAETLLVLEALVDALGAAIGALELVESPTGRFVCERIPNRAARLLFALDEHRQGEPVRLDERGEPVRLDERGAATASRGVPPCSEVLYDAGIDHKTSFWSVDDRQRRVQESVHDICERLALEATGSRPETCSERAPRQLHTLRQRRALARGRACLLAASPEMAALEALPIPCPLPLNARGDTTAEAAAVLDRLLCIDSEAERSHLRKLFRRFDANVDELLDREEFGVLMRNCFPSRVADADSLCSSMFDGADVDDSGAISFEEFVKHCLEMSLDRLVLPGVMDVATDLGLAYTDELHAFAVTQDEPIARPRVPGAAPFSGVALVAYRLAYLCVRLDEQAVSGGRPLLAGPGAEAVEGGESHREWQRLRHVLDHDCERLDYSIGTAAAAGALAANPGRKLPQWLLDHIHPPLPGGPARAPYMLRLSARIAQPVVWITPPVGEPREGDYARNDSALPDNSAVKRAADEVFEPYRAAQPRLEMRGVVAWGGDACVTIPYASSANEAHRETIALIKELRRKDPGCRPLRRNPAALARLLLATHEESQQLEPLRAALALVQAGCKAALEEKDTFMTQEALNESVRGQLLCDSEGRDRWVTCGLIDALHAAVANLQGVKPYKADGNARLGDSDELSSIWTQTYRDIEAYLDIDVAQPWVCAEKARKVAEAIVEYDDERGVEWAGELPYFVKARDSDAPRVRSREELFAQMIEAAIRR